MLTPRRSSILLLAFCSTACDTAPPEPPAPPEPVIENYSYSRPDSVRVTHIELDLTVDFEARRVQGSAALDLERSDGADRLWLDTWDLQIEAVHDGTGGAELAGPWASRCRSSAGRWRWISRPTPKGWWSTMPPATTPVPCSG